MRYCYIVCHTFHDMYTQEDKPIIDEVYESKADADKRVRELRAEEPLSDYYVEESELYSIAEPPVQKEVPDERTDLMIMLIKEIEWYYQNRKSHILPIVYEDMLKDAVHYASQNMWEDASVWINGLRKAREETE